MSLRELLDNAYSGKNVSGDINNIPKVYETKPDPFDGTLTPSDAESGLRHIKEGNLYITYVVAQINNIRKIMKKSKAAFIKKRRRTT